MLFLVNPDNQNYNEWQKDVILCSVRKSWILFSPCSDVGAHKGNDILQVVTKGLRENRQIEEETQAFVYSN
nr:hypothetical protein CFP56_40503 [Quercus suber]